MLSQATPAGSPMVDLTASASKRCHDEMEPITRTHGDGVVEFMCSHCRNWGGVQDQSFWNRDMINKFSYFKNDPVRLGEKTIRCRKCYKEKDQQNLAFQQANRPQQYQSMGRPQATSPEPCRDCGCELRRTGGTRNISENQWKNKNANDRRCMKCALEHSKHNPHVADTNSRRKVSP